MPVGHGTATIDFGSTPTTDTYVNVTGQTGLVAGTDTQVEAWLRLEATVDHSVDEVWVHPPLVHAGNVSADAFTIYARAHDLREYGTFKVDYIWST